MLKGSFTCCRTSKHQLFPWRKHKVTMQSYFAIFPHLEPASFSSCHLRWIKNSLLSHAIPSLCTENQTAHCALVLLQTPLKLFYASPRHHTTIKLSKERLTAGGPTVWKDAVLAALPLFPLLGFRRAEKLQVNLQKHLSLSQKTATTAICCSSLTLNLNNPLQPHWT